MDKKKVRCNKVYIEIKGYYNMPIYVIENGGWTNFKLFSCINCGEIFIVDYDNPKFHNQNLLYMLFESSCPKCERKFNMTLKNYPETIRLSNGEILENLKIKQYMENNNTSEIVEFYEIKL